MAKVGFWLKGARGKLGSSSISTQNGTTIIRTINENPTNPKTSKQMYQRAIFATIAKAAASMKFIVNHSFENVKDGEDCVRKFRALNLNALRNQVAADIADGATAAEIGAKLAPKGYPYITPNAYIVSAGSLASPKVKLVYGEDVIKRDRFTIPIVGTVTCKKFLQEVFGLQPGEQLTLCVIYAGTGAQFISVGSGAGQSCFENEFAAKRVVFLPYAGNEEDWDADCVDSGEIATPAFENVIDTEKTDMGFFNNLFGEIMANASEGVTTISSAETAIDASNCKAGALIRSKIANGKWQYSNATLVVAAPTLSYNYGLAPVDAVETYASSVSIGNDSDPFLDEGGEGGSNSDF